MIAATNTNSEILNSVNRPPYLDLINGSSRGDEIPGKRENEARREWVNDSVKMFEGILEAAKVTDEISKANICQKTYAKFTDVATGRKTCYQQLKCYKWWCPTCGGWNGELHRHKYESVLRRITNDGYFIRQLIFTVPENIRSRFMNRKMIDSLFALVERLIKGEFGEHIGDKLNSDGTVKEKKYRLNIPVVAYLHLDGDEKDTFNPHINIHIFEKEDEHHKLSPDRLSRIRESYRKRLIHMLREDVPVVNIHYSYKLGTREMKRAILYMTKPTDREMIDHIDFALKKLLCLDLKRFRFVRFWGDASNSKYKQNHGARKNRSGMMEINGEAFTLVGIITQSEFEDETAGKTLAYSESGFITIIDDPPG